MEEEKKVIRKIIGLYGRKNSGKTTTLNLLIELLGERGKGDDPVTIENYRGKKIVISPGGDTKAIVQKNIKFFEDQKADIFVTATRNGDRTGSSKALDDHYKKAHDALLIWFGKNHSTSLGKMIDVMQAKELRALLDLLIEEWDNYPGKWSY